MQIRKVTNCWISNHLILTNYVCRWGISEWNIIENRSKIGIFQPLLKLIIRQKFTLSNKWKKKNTERKRQSAVKQFHVWFHRNPGNETRDITEMQPGKLVNYLGSFRFSIRKADGSDYEPDTLTNYHGSIDRFLRERKKCPYSLITYRESSTSKTVLTSKRKELKRRIKRQFIKCSRPS